MTTLIVFGCIFAGITFVGMFFLAPRVLMLCLAAYISIPYLGQLSWHVQNRACGPVLFPFMLIGAVALCYCLYMDWCFFINFWINKYFKNRSWFKYNIG